MPPPQQQEAKQVRYDLLQALGGHSQATQKLKRVKAAIAKAEEKKAAQQQKDVGVENGGGNGQHNEGRGGAEETKDESEEGQTQARKDKGGGGAYDEDVMVIDEEGGGEGGEASRDRVRRELEDRLVALEIEILELLDRARRLHALRTRETHEACLTLPDMVMRRQLPFPLPKAARPLSAVYARIRHLKTINGHHVFPVYCLKVS